MDGAGGPAGMLLSACSRTPTLADLPPCSHHLHSVPLPLFGLIRQLTEASCKQTAVLGEQTDFGANKKESQTGAGDELRRPLALLAMLRPTAFAEGLAGQKRAC